MLETYKKIYIRFYRYGGIYERETMVEGSGNLPDISKKF